MALLYAVTFSLAILFLSLFTSFVKYLIRKSILFVAIPIIWVACVISQKSIFQSVLEADNHAVANHFHVLVWVSMALLVVNAVLVYANLLLMKAKLYETTEHNFRFLDNIGTDVFRIKKRNPAYLLLEIRLFIRNKRLRSIGLIPLFLVILTFYLFSQTKNTDAYTRLFWFTSLNGALGFSYAQYMFSWEAGFFDCISTTPFNFLKSLWAKYILCTAGGLMIILASLYFIVNGGVGVHIILTAMLYNAGFGFFLTFFTATFNNKRIDLDSSILFNIQGYDNIQLLSISLVTVIPVLCLLLLDQFFSQTISLLIMNMLCAISIFKLKSWFRLIHKQFLKRKYINLEGYRK
jgi:hypothetical protein